MASRCLTRDETLRPEEYGFSGVRPEAQGSRKSKGALILSFLMPHALRLGPSVYTAVTKDADNAAGVRFPSSFLEADA
jgi:hypothetical protein